MFINTSFIFFLFFTFSRFTPIQHSPSRAALLAHRVRGHDCNIVDEALAQQAEVDEVELCGLLKRRLAHIQTVDALILTARKRDREGKKIGKEEKEQEQESYGERERLTRTKERERKLRRRERRRKEMVKGLYFFYFGL